MRITRHVFHAFAASHTPLVSSATAPLLAPDRNCHSLSQQQLACLQDINSHAAVRKSASVGESAPARCNESARPRVEHMPRAGALATTASDGRFGGRNQVRTMAQPRFVSTSLTPCRTSRRRGGPHGSARSVPNAKHFLPQISRHETIDS